MSEHTRRRIDFKTNSQTLATRKMARYFFMVTVRKIKSARQQVKLLDQAKIYNGDISSQGCCIFWPDIFIHNAKRCSV